MPRENRAVWGGVVRPAQQEGERVNALPRDLCGELLEHADGARWVISVGLVKFF